MTIILFILGIVNIFLAGSIWGGLDSSKLLGISPTVKEYGAIILCFIVGVYCIISAIGKVSV